MTGACLKQVKVRGAAVVSHCAKKDFCAWLRESYNRIISNMFIEIKFVVKLQFFGELSRKACCLTGACLKEGCGGQPLRKKILCSASRGSSIFDGINSLRN